MPAGRPPKPTHLKLIEGNRGKRPIKAGEPKPTGAPVAPKSLTKNAVAVWKRVLATMPLNVYTGADEHLLSAYCEAVARHREASEALKVYGLVSTGSTGQEVVSPWLKIQNDQARLIVTLGARLGLDPVARQALATGDDTPAKGKFDFD